MSYNNQTLITDLKELPVPQYYNSTTDKYEVIQGSNGASRVLLYDQNGNPLFTQANPGTVSTQRQVGTVLNTPSTPITATTTSADLPVGNYSELAIDVNISAISGTSASYQLTINRKGADGTYYPIYTGSAQSAIGKISLSLGNGSSTNASFGNTIQVVETIAGTTPSVTRSVSILGK